MYSTVCALRSCRRGRLSGCSKSSLLASERPLPWYFAFVFTFTASSTAAFSFGLFSFAAFASEVCVAASGFDVLIQIIESGEKVRGEVVEVAGGNVWVLFFPRGDNRVKLRPALDRLAESFDFRDVGTGCVARSLRENHSG